LIKKFFLVIASSFAMAGCGDRISTLGSAYYADTVGFHTIIRMDTGFMQFRDTLRPFVTYLGLDYNLTNYSPLMIIGKVLPNNPGGSNENLESWGLMKFNPISSDSIGMILSVRLLLKDLNYMYGDVSNSIENFQVWNETNYKVTDSTNPLTNPLTIGDLSSSPVGSIDTIFNDTADDVLIIPLPGINSTNFSNLSVPSFAFVVTPNQSKATPVMTNARAFGTTDNGVNDLNSVEELQIALNNGDTIYEGPTLDEHYVIDNSASLKNQNEFTLRGGTGAREHISFNLTRPGDTAKLTQFTTVNNADLVLHLDQANSRQSDLSIDTSGPAIVQITGVGDTACALIGFGYRDTSNMSDIRVHFQIRGLIEDWLRSPVNNFGLELRSGFVTRLIPGSGGVNIGVEDNTLNRWTFYGQNYSDATKHPQLILTYSNLH
jgi:hypothetical protein